MPANYVPFDKEEWLRLEKKADFLRRYCLQTAVWGGSGHVGGSLSAMDCMTILYNRFMKIDPQNPDMPDRDRFVLSKGHCAVGYAPVLVDCGVMPEEELKIFNLTGAKIGMHMDCNKVKGVDCSTGSLGHGLSLAVGFALAGRVNGIDYMNYVLTGDGELNEGVIWETAMSAAKFKLDNLIAIVDYNKVQLDGTTDDVMPLGDLAAKWEAFGWTVLECDGHDLEALDFCVSVADGAVGAPTVIIANTIKGKGVSFMEGKNTWHGKAIDDESFAKAMEELGGAANV